MNAHSSMIHVRMDNDLKDRATEALAAMGLSTADAVRLHGLEVGVFGPLGVQRRDCPARAVAADTKSSVCNFAAAQESMANPS